MIKYLIKIPILKRLIPSLGIRLLKILKKNRGFFNIDGFKMYLDFLDPIDRAIILNKTYEIEEINILTQLIRNNSVTKFIDIGANCGFYSFQFAMEKLDVFAFEPNSDALLKMNNTIDQNKNLENKIKIYPFGLSNNNSIMQMRSMIKYGYTQTGGSSVTIEKQSLENKYKIYEAKFKIGDEILKFKKNNVAIKIDVEGHELNVLKGIQDLLKSNNCIIQIEIFKENFNLVNSFLLEKNFILVDQFKERANYFYSNYSDIVD
ncbi:FkbM family methyltransferase [Candidatus Pelagibacter bacterium]|nr:FkbM family methyltransferase [Candidatus Pelagibacter bacterium]